MMFIVDLFTKYKDRMPSWLWLMVILSGFLILIAIPVAFIYLVSHFEGFASIIFLVIGWFVFGIFAKQEKRNSFILGAAILFFALMGMAIDQPGNYIYNQALAFSCPEGTTFSRNVITLNPLPGRTDFVQNFQCSDATGNVKYRIPIGMVILTRFVEYIVIGYLLLGIRMVIHRLSRGTGKTGL